MTFNVIDDDKETAAFFDMYNIYTCTQRVFIYICLGSIFDDNKTTETNITSITLIFN